MNILTENLSPSEGRRGDGYPPSNLVSWYEVACTIRWRFGSPKLTRGSSSRDAIRRNSESVQEYFHVTPLVPVSHTARSHSSVGSEKMIRPFESRGSSSERHAARFQPPVRCGYLLPKLRSSEARVGAKCQSDLAGMLPDKNMIAVCHAFGYCR